MYVSALVFTKSLLVYMIDSVDESFQIKRGNDTLHVKMEWAFCLSQHLPCNKLMLHVDRSMNLANMQKCKSLNRCSVCIEDFSPGHHGCVLKISCP